MPCQPLHNRVELSVSCHCHAQRLLLYTNTARGCGRGD